jgi:pilus assembly protein CpaD
MNAKQRLKSSRFGSLLGLTALVALAGCTPPLGMPHSKDFLSTDGTQIFGPDCMALSVPSTANDAGFKRPSVAFGCATFTNLAAQIDRPADLVAPLPLGPADATTSAAAVRRYETGKVMPLNSEGTTLQIK